MEGEKEGEEDGEEGGKEGRGERERMKDGGHVRGRLSEEREKKN